MKRSNTLIFTFLLILALFLFPQKSFAQLSGTYTIPGTPFATIQAAVDSLNLVGVGAGGVTFNVTSGYTENITAPITITATGIAGNTIAFQKSGVGANPLVTRTDVGVLTTTTLGGAGDAVIQLNGTDYITFNGIDAAATDQGIEYGYLTHKPDGTNGCQFVTITNCVVTLTKGTSAYVAGIYIGNGTISTSSAVGVTVTATGGMNSNINITGNTVQNVHAGILVRGSSVMPDSMVTIGQSGAGNIIQNYGGGAVSTTYGIYFIYVKSPSVAYNTIDNAGGGGTAHASTLYAVFFSSGVSGDLVCSNNAFTLANAAASSTTNYIYSSNACDSEIVENNTFASTGTLPAGSLYFIYLSNATPNKLISGNTTVGTIDKAGGGTYCYYNLGSPTSGTETIINNTFSNINIAAGSSTFYGIYSNTAVGQNRVLSNNTLSNINSSSTGSHYCIYGIAANNNQVDNNLVYNVSGGGSVYGLYAGGTNAMIYNNSVYGVTSTTTGTASVYGAYSTTGTDVTWYNNFFSDLNAPNSTNATAGTYGMYITSGTNVNLYYNTVYLNYISTIAGNQSAALYVSATPTSVDMRNNVFVNNVDVTVGTRAMAFRKSSTVLTNLSASTNNNLYYAGTPSASHLIFYDGTNSDSTLADYKIRVSPLESASITENPPFVNSTVTPYNLHMNTAIATQTEGGGTPVAGITVDYDGDTRNASTPDIGADEFNGIGADLNAPIISYNLIPNTADTTSVSLTATITDPSGVAGGANLPRLYIKKTTDVSYIFDNAPVIVGDDYTFTINYAALGGVSIGDTLMYYVAAQDVPGNAGTNPAGGSGSNPPGSVPPPTPNTYIIVDVPLSGTYTVGLTLFEQLTGKKVYFETRTRTVTKDINGVDAVEDINSIGEEKKNQPITPDLSPHFVTVTEIYSELMENGKPFDTDFFRENSLGVYPTITTAVNDLVLRGMSGPVTFSLIDTNYPNETYPIMIPDVAGSSSTNTITIKPAAGIQTVIPGSETQGTSTFQLGGADFVVVDGSNTVGGVTKDLHITSQISAPAFHFYGGSSNNVVKNIVFESEYSSTASGTLIFGATASGDSNYINNCTMKSSDTVATRQGVGVYFFSTNTSTFNQIVGCEIVNFNNYGIRLQGAPTTNIVVSGCDIYMTTPTTTSTIYGAYVSRVDGLIFEKNKIRELLSTSPTTISGIYYFGSATSGSAIVRNNFISISGATGLTAGTLRGLDYYAYAANSFEAYYNSIYIGGTDVTTGTTYGFVKRDAASIYKAYNNAVYNARSNSTGTGKHYAVYVSNTVAPTLEMDYNNYFSDGIGGVFGYYGAADVADLLAWQTASGQDSNSVSGNPSYASTTDLHVPNGTVTILESTGTPIAGITTDIDAQTRNVTTPDIGADEFAGFSPASALAGTYYIGVAGSGPGGTDPEFATLKAACDTLNISNVSGNTTFFITSNLVEPANVSIGIDPGSYTVTFKPYTATVDTITFTQVADNPGVSGGWVLGTPSLTITSATNYGLVTTENIIIDGSNTVAGTTRDLVVRTAAGISGNTNPFRVIGDVNNCVLKNLVVRTGQSVSYGISITNRFFAATGNWTPDNITVTNCDVINNLSSSGQGIAISNSGTPTTFPTGMEFSFNTVVARTRGIFINYGGDANIFNNDITVNQTSTGLFSSGILTLSIGDTTNVINIYNNKFTLLSTANANSGTYGIAAIEPGSRGIYNIYNNMITGFAATTSTANPNCIINGIRVTSPLPKVNLYFNTIYLNDLAITPGTGTVLYTGIFVSNGTVVANNNIVQTDEADFPSYAIYRSGTSGTLVSDYNDFYYSDTTNGFTGYWNAAPTKTLLDWQTASGLDVNSLNVVAPFTSASDLHIPDGTMTLLESAGTPIAMVTTDFDGQLRNASTPDIGADEFAGLPPIFAPTNLTAVADTFAILLNWTDNSANELGFYIERKNGDSLSVDPFVVIDTVATDVVSYNDLGRTPNTTYTYRVQAFNLISVSPYSNEVTATTIIPVELTSFAATANDREISIAWSTATEINNRGFELERKLEAEWQKVVFLEGKGTTTEKSDYSYTDKFTYESFQGTIQYRLKQIDFDGSVYYSDAISVEVDFTPKEYTLYQNYPNPFNPSTTIKFALPFDSNVRIAVYNLLGEQVDVIFEQVKEVGYHNVSWNASSLASGVYFYTIEAKSIDGLKNFSSVKKMMLVK